MIAGSPVSSIELIPSSRPSAGIDGEDRDAAGVGAREDRVELPLEVDLPALDIPHALEGIGRGTDPRLRPAHHRIARADVDRCADQEQRDPSLETGDHPEQVVERAQGAALALRLVGDEALELEPETIGGDGWIVEAPGCGSLLDAAGLAAGRAQVESDVLHLLHQILRAAAPRQGVARAARHRGERAVDRRAVGGQGGVQTQGLAVEAGDEHAVGRSGLVREEALELLRGVVARSGGDLGGIDIDHPGDRSGGIHDGVGGGAEVGAGAGVGGVPGAGDAAVGASSR